MYKPIVPGSKSTDEFVRLQLFQDGDAVSLAVVTESGDRLTTVLTFRKGEGGVHLIRIPYVSGTAGIDRDAFDSNKIRLR